MVEDERGSTKRARAWRERVRLGTDGAGHPFAYRPHEVLAVGDDRALEVARRLSPDVRIEGELGPFVRLVGVRDPIAVVHELRLHGITAQPNHVLFAHCDCCPPHPSAPCGGTTASPVYASPVYASPVYASPVYASPVYASPVYASPVYASPVYASPNGPPTKSSVRPAPAGTPTAELAARLGAPATPTSATVIVLDTGFAGSFKPAALATAPVQVGGSDVDAPDEDGNGEVDPAAGHGTFIAGVVEQVAPGTNLAVHRVLTTMGDGDEWSIAACIAGLAVDDPARTVLNLSFGGYVYEDALALAWAIRGIQAAGVVVVASAGNDATCRPTYPAALPGVIGVGAVGPSGPAPFTNYGAWVRACAPGVDILSSFFQGFNGSEPPADGVDPDAFAGWALWSGTSFAAPVVAGALARLMAQTGCSAQEAVARTIDEPALLRIPNLGTVVNVL